MILCKSGKQQSYKQILPSNTKGLVLSYITKLIYLFLSTIILLSIPLLSPVYAQTTTPTFQLPLTGLITTYYSSYHPAIDIANIYGTPIHPIASGTVIKAGYDHTGYGNMVVIDHGNGYQSMYAHMQAIIVTVDQKVTPNMVIGHIGLTGNTTGPHLHLQISKNGTTINPLKVLPPFPKLSINGPKVTGTGGAILTSLPKTGTPTLTLLAILFAPLGLLLIKHRTEHMVKNPQWTWENRTFKKQ